MATVDERVKKIIAESTCGSLNRAVRPRDLVISSDIIDFTQTRLTLLPDKFTYLCTGAQIVLNNCREEFGRDVLIVEQVATHFGAREDVGELRAIEAGEWAQHQTCRGQNRLHGAPHRESCMRFA